MEGEDKVEGHKPSQEAGDSLRARIATGPARPWRTIKIVSDGRLSHTFVTDAETGERIKGVQVIDWHIDHVGLTAESQMARATLKVIKAELEVTTQATIEDTDG